MTDDAASSPKGARLGAGIPPGIDARDFAKDWVTLWQSELAAMSVDRELQESWQKALALWATAANTMLSAMPTVWPDGCWPGQSGGTSGTVAPAGPPAAAAASDAGDAQELKRLAERVAELERKLGELGKLD